MITISIIVPVYNVEDYLWECLDSIINQTYPSLEVILVDDGSTDASGNICDIYAERDARITVLHTHNQGQSAARNIGIKQSHGDYIMFIDSDDFITLNCVEDIVNIISNNENAEIICGKMIKYHFKKGRVQEETFQYDKKKIVNKNGIQVLEYLFREMPVGMWSPCRSIYKRKLIMDNKLYFLEGITSEDLDLIPRIYTCAKIVDVYEKPFYYYRQQRINSTITTAKAKKYFDIVFVIKRHLMFLEKFKGNENFQKQFLIQLANIYAAYVAIIGELPKHERKRVVDELKKIKGILLYAKGVKAKYIAIFSMIFGFTFTYWLYGTIKQFQPKFMR